jgi:hypothetical protein
MIMDRKGGVLLSGLRSKMSVSNVSTLQDQSWFLTQTLVMVPALSPQILRKLEAVEGMSLAGQNSNAR